MKARKSILLIEDDHRVSEYLKVALRLSGHTVECCGDGRSALELSHNNQFQVIISDYNMPGIDGAETVRELRGRFADAFIIGYSGNMMKETFLDAGADVFLQKPFHIQELITLIQNRSV